MNKKYLFFLPLIAVFSLNAQNQKDIIAKKALEIEPKTIEWRRHIHQNPELSNREVETQKYIATYLRSLGGIEVKTNYGINGVIGILKGGKPGPVMALRADMDALPVVERVNLPFASKVKATYEGKEVGVMHACGHDTHVAMLMSAAKILKEMQSEIEGTVMFLFQPAEEGAPPGEEGGAKLMLKQGLFTDHKVDVAFGLHIASNLEVDKLAVKAGGAMAASDRFKITVKGRQSHGSKPWGGIDPIVVSAQIINGLQTIVSRQMDITQEPVVITVGQINGGVRNNIMPEECEMVGTIRTLDVKMQKDVWARIERTATNIAEAAGATAKVEITPYTPVLVNNIELVGKMMPTLETAANGEQNVRVVKAQTGAEDFAYYAEAVPSMFVSVGGMEKGKSSVEVPSHHTPDFYIDESGMKTGIRTLCHFVFDYPKVHKK
jgi:amidohydrolase